MDIFSLVTKMKDLEASDLYLTVGIPPTMRAGFFLNNDSEKLAEKDIWHMAEQIISGKQIEQLKLDKELNIAFSDESGERYRANFFFQQQKLGIVVRYIRKEVPTLEMLELPEIFKDSIMMPNGLLLLVGNSGSGKSTSIAAMLDYRNKNGGGHIVTVEDPIEYVHENKKCIFTQREIGTDTISCGEALKNAMRQRPDVIYVGEIRDAETVGHVLRMAETGHLCVATVHALNASHAVERLVNMFPVNYRNQYLHSLAQVLKVIIGQRLIPGRDGKVHLSLDIMKNEGFSKPLIIEGKISELRELMTKNQDVGMITFDQSLLKLHNEGKISREGALSKADNPELIKLALLKKNGDLQRPMPRIYKEETGF